jgi:hypothetical protein
MRTGLALHAAKQALLAYVALKAGETGEATPGRLPCPETPFQPGTDFQGQAPPVVATSHSTCTAVGRLPWRTLGIDQLRDGYGEPLWYGVPRETWALLNSSTDLIINPDLGNQLSVDGQPNAVVAVIIAPGRPINSLSEPGTPPPGCTAVNQYPNRYTVPYGPSKFLECGNETESYITAATSPWGNDRLITITAAEVMEAIMGSVADRIQRETLPALYAWRSGEGQADWGASFLPYASAFGNPATNDYCGDVTPSVAHEGWPPLGSACAKFTASASSILGLVPLGCTQTTANVQCSFMRVLGLPPLSVRITASADIRTGFKSAVYAPADVIAPSASTKVVSAVSVDTTTGIATLTVDVSYPLLASGTTVTVTIPHLRDANVLSDPRVTWFTKNKWHNHTYYAVARSTVLPPPPPPPPDNTCTNEASLGCLHVRGLPVTGSPPELPPGISGNYWNKRVVMVLAGMPLAGQSRACPGPGCGNLTHYFESDNASAGDRMFRANTRTPNPLTTVLAPPYPDFNDRASACPLQETNHLGAMVTIC